MSGIMDHFSSVGVYQSAVGSAFDGKGKSVYRSSNESTTLLVNGSWDDRHFPTRQFGSASRPSNRSLSFEWVEVRPGIREVKNRLF